MSTFQPIRGKRIRVTQLDKCGNVPAAADPDAWLATEGFISVALSSDVESGNEIITKKANGAICVNERSADSFKRFGLEITFCGVDTDLLTLITNAEVYEGYETNANGIVVPEGTIDKQFAFELWTGLSGQACEPGVEEASGYLLLPFVQAGVMGDVEINGENAIDFSMSGAYTKGGNGWGVGPYEVLGEGGTAKVLPTALDPLDHLLLINTNIVPPEDSDGMQPMPAAPVG